MCLRATFPVQPTLTEDDTSLEISCPGYNPDAAPAPAPPLLDLTIVNKCSQPVQVKVRPWPLEGAQWGDRLPSVRTASPQARAQAGSVPAAPTLAGLTRTGPAAPAEAGPSRGAAPRCRPPTPPHPTPKGQPLPGAEHAP